MNAESQISDLYSMLFNESPDSDTLESLLKVFHEHDNSMDYLEVSLRDSDKFKLLSEKLEIELGVAELLYVIKSQTRQSWTIFFYKSNNRAKQIIRLG